MECCSIPDLIFILLCFRDHLYKFFFPPDWQTMVVTQPPQPGEKREYQSFEISLSTLNEATIDVLFSKNKVNKFR